MNTICLLCVLLSGPGIHFKEEGITSNPGITLSAYPDNLTNANCVNTKIGVIYYGDKIVKVK